MGKTCSSLLPVTRSSSSKCLPSAIGMDILPRMDSPSSLGLWRTLFVGKIPSFL
jgi:hypothetical protein